MIGTLISFNHFTYCVFYTYLLAYPEESYGVMRVCLTELSAKSLHHCLLFVHLLQGTGVWCCLFSPEGPLPAAPCSFF